MKYLYDLFFKREEEQQFLLNTIGVLCLLIGFCALLLKYAHALWPCIAIAFSGFFLTWKGKKAGFACSLLLLLCAFPFLRTRQELFWTALFTLSVAVSWFLLFLGQREALFLNQYKNETTEGLREEVALLQTALQRNAEVFSQELKEKENAIALLQNELHRAKEKVEQEEDKTIYPQLDACYNQLKEQFEEKSEALHQTRKQLFAMESQYLALEKEREEDDYSPSHEDLATVNPLKEFEEECRQLESQVLLLQEFISSLLISKKKPSLRKQKKKDEEDLFSRIKQ